MSLQSKLEALAATAATAEARGQQPAGDAIARLIREEERARPLRVGDAAPAFSLRAYGGSRVSSAELLRSGPLVITFYRGLWCPYCQRDLRGLDAALEDIRGLHASAVAVSRPRGPDGDTPSDHGLSLAFPVLEDAAGDLAVRFGIRWSAEDVSAIDAALGANLVTFRGTEPWIVPMQARFVVDRQGAVVFAEAAFDYNDSSDPAGLLPLLAGLRRRTSSR